MAFGHCMLDSSVDLFFDLVYTWPKITVSAITQGIFIRFLLDSIYRCSWVISRSSSQMGYVDLFFDLVYPGSEITVSAITHGIFIRFSLDSIYRCSWVISRSSL